MEETSIKAVSFLVVKVRLLLLMFASGIMAAAFFALFYVAPMQYLTLLTIATPVVAFLVVTLAFPAYFLLRKFKVRLSLLVCIFIGATIGAVPGLILWITSASTSLVWSALGELHGASSQVFIFAFFGGAGGLVFASLCRHFKLQ